MDLPYPPSLNRDGRSASCARNGVSEKRDFGAVGHAGGGGRCGGVAGIHPGARGVAALVVL